MFTNNTDNKHLSTIPDAKLGFQSLIECDDDTADIVIDESELNNDSSSTTASSQGGCSQGHIQSLPTYVDDDMVLISSQDEQAPVYPTFDTSCSHDEVSIHRGGSK